MSRLQELIDKKVNHDCNADGGTCSYCEQLNAEIYALEQKKKAREGMSSMTCKRCNLKTYNRQMCEWCYCDPKVAKTDEELRNEEAQVDDLREEKHHNHMK